jgi:hypothetical protein
MSDLFSVCDEHDWANQKAGLQCPHCRIAELEAEVEAVRIYGDSLRAENKRLRELLGKAYERLQYFEMDCTQLEDDILAALQEGE